MARLTFDTETTGKWHFDLPHDHPAQPNLVQLGAMLHDDVGVKRAEVSLLITPEPGWEFEAEAVAIHGITKAIATSYGVTLTNACFVFHNLISSVDTIVAHNIAFDRKVMQRALGICGAPALDWGSIQQRCTMQTATNIVKAPKANGARGYKWPKLAECIRFFFGEDLDGAHDALVDVNACVRVHDALQQKGCWA